MCIHSHLHLDHGVYSVTPTSLGLPALVSTVTAGATINYLPIQVIPSILSLTQ